MNRKHGLYLLVVLAFLVSASGYALPPSLPQPLGPTQTFSSSGSPQSSSRIIYGPQDGSMIHYTGLSTIYPTGVNIADFWANVTFYNPFSTDAGTWDYGISFRVSSDAWMLLAVKSSKEWSLMCAKNGGFEYPYSGTVDNLDVSPNGKNTIELSAYGTQGHFFVNGELISNLDLSCTTAPGDVNLRVGWLVSAYDGHETRFTNLTIGRDPNQNSAPEVPAPAPPPQTNSASDVIGDLDGDRISQPEENWLANTFTPIYYYDVDEPETNFGFAYQVSPKTLPDGINQEGVILTIVALYRLDTAYPVLFPVMGTGIPAFPVGWHNGDAEAVELWLTRWEGSCNNEAFSETYSDPNGSSRCYILRRMVIHRHEHVYIYEIPAPPDVFPVTFDMSLEDNHSTPGNRHPWLNISKGKHAAYINDFWECDKSYYQGNFNLEDYVGILKTKEYCSGYYDSTQAGKAIFPYFDPSQNVGEVGAKLFTEMQNHPILGYFYGEDIWSTDHFCGGIVTGGACSSGMMGKWCGGGSQSYCAEADDYIRLPE